MDATTFFESISEAVQSGNDNWLQHWKNKEAHVNRLRDAFLAQTEFSDLKAFDLICREIPANTVVHLGNSSPVRYALILDRVENALYFCNRGTAGIDGCLSTAVGFASESEKLNTVILGDLSFFYDSNALWNKYIGSNLRIIVIHNGGGNIFSLIKGPGESPAFAEHFFAGILIRPKDWPEHSDWITSGQPTKRNCNWRWMNSIRPTSMPPPCSRFLPMPK
jgi:2-succinyl-5-enolpyruvyl-6-hydroxy-3-cyclohexene-1-carboxylate synthase